ncbi:MAG: hypothetical protein WBV68_08265 [Exiguobacterium oxidotolerans]|jgi:hypothetical protein
MQENIYEIISTIINVILLILIKFQNVKVKKLTSIVPPPTEDRCRDCIYKHGMEKTIDEITKRITRTGETDIDS